MTSILKMFKILKLNYFYLNSNSATCELFERSFKKLYEEKLLRQSRKDLIIK
jgi:hypothetical protein